MARSTLAELTARATAATEPGFTAASTPRLGGVDPLGMRQINFDLMDQVFPGLNNVARHIRPFVLATWAWRRANQIAQKQGKREIPVDQMSDFVDRIDVIFAWSQFMSDPATDLPGSRVLANILRADQWTFGGSAWRQRRKERRFSTALTAPINYGPALRMLGWVQPHSEHREVLIPTPAAASALDAFEAKIKDRLNHAAFSQFGSVTVTAKEVGRWSEAWALASPTRPEKTAMKEMLFGPNAPLSRQRAGELLLAAAKRFSTKDTAVLRAAMAGRPSRFEPPTDLIEIRDTWRVVQMRQLFRLSLEALLCWALTIVSESSKTTEALIALFLDCVPVRARTVREWLASLRPRNVGPTEVIDEISEALASSPDEVPRAVLRGIALSLAEAPEKDSPGERPDRLPLSRARREAAARGAASPREFVRHLIESWVLAQHVYWSVGRGLADARAQGKTLLRLKIVLDEGGWSVAPGVSPGPPPLPTPDRLKTVVSLADECGLL